VTIGRLRAFAHPIWQLPADHPIAHEHHALAEFQYLQVVARLLQSCSKPRWTTRDADEAELCGGTRCQFHMARRM